MVETSGPNAGRPIASGRGDPEVTPTSPQARAVAMTTTGEGGLSGNLVADPTIIFTTRGNVLVRMRVASSGRIRDHESGQWREGPVQFFEVTCWGQCAQNVGEHFRKGDLVLAIGVWQREEWTDHEGTAQVRRTLAARHVGLGVTFKAARYVRTIIEES